MAILGEITHTTTYRYVKPVTFGTHRAMFLPRRGSSARLLGWSAKTSVQSRVHWVTDSRSNAVTVMEFSEPCSELTFTFRVRGIYFGIKGIEALYNLTKAAYDAEISRYDATEAKAGRYLTVLGLLVGAFLVKFDDLLAVWNIRAARDAAWANAAVLWTLQGTGPIERSYLEALDRSFGMAGRGLLRRI